MRGRFTMLALVEARPSCSGSLKRDNIGWRDVGPCRHNQHAGGDRHQEKERKDRLSILEKAARSAPVVRSPFQVLQSLISLVDRLQSLIRGRFTRQPSGCSSLTSLSHAARMSCIEAPGLNPSIA